MPTLISSLWLLACGSAALWLLHRLAHQLLLYGLQVERMPHSATPASFGIPGACWRGLYLPGQHDDRLFAWYIHPASHFSGPRAAVLLIHGWGANASTMLDALPALHHAGFAALALDARCHGLSSTARFSSLPRFAEDISAGLSWLKEQQGVDGQRLALIGHSTGAGAAMLRAAQGGDVAALVSLSAFAHPAEVMRRWLTQVRLPQAVIGSWILRHVQHVMGYRFDTIAPLHTLPRLSCPVMLVHGEADTTVPIDDACRLHASRPGSLLLRVRNGTHDLRNSLEAEHYQAVLQFLIDALALKAADTGAIDQPPWLQARATVHGKC